jgi:hypothetical protein
MNLPLFSANLLPMSIPCQVVESHAYNIVESSIPQSCSIEYSTSLYPVSYTATSAPQSLHTTREPHYDFSLHGSHMVKSESMSPLYSAYMYNNVSYTANCKRFPPEPTEATTPRFATDVDTLMKAIQAKQTASPQKQEVAKVSPTGTKPLWYPPRTDSNAGGRAQSQPKTKETLPVPHARL